MAPSIAMSLVATIQPLVFRALYYSTTVRLTLPMVIKRSIMTAPAV